LFDKHHPKDDAMDGRFVGRFAEVRSVSCESILPRGVR